FLDVLKRPSAFAFERILHDGPVFIDGSLTRDEYQFSYLQGRCKWQITLGDILSCDNFLHNLSFLLLHDLKFVSNGIDIDLCCIFQAVEDVLNLTDLPFLIVVTHWSYRGTNIHLVLQFDRSPE